MSGTFKPQVLLADDDPIFRSLAVSRLKRLNCEVVEAEDGLGAWQLAREQAFSLAIIDFEMPGLDGINLIQCLRGHPHTRQMPVVMCTSRTDNSAMNSAVGAGATSFLTKPVNWSLFVSHLQHLIHLSEAAEGGHEITAEAPSVPDDKLEGFLTALKQRLNQTGSERLALASIRLMVDRFEAEFRRGA